MKAHYSDGIKDALVEYAKLKDARGEHDRARELEHKAGSIQTK